MFFKRDKDKRKTRRVPKHCLLKYRKEGEGDKQKLTFVRNISAGGILFFTQEEIQPGAVLHMELNIPTYKGNPIKIVVVARTVHEEKLKNFKGYNIGAAFQKIREEDRKFLLENIDK